MEFKSLPRHRKDFYNDHKKPVTRRDFLALGLLGSAGACLLSPREVLAKAVLNQLSPESLAVQPAFLVIDCAGGAGFPGNFLVGGKGGAEDLLKSYTTLGWDPAKSGYDKRFGLPMGKVEVSKIFAGITQAASPAAQANFRMGSLIHTSTDDNPNNLMSAANLALMSDAASKQFAQVLGSTQNISGGNSRFADDANKKAYFLNNILAYKDSFGLAAIYGGDLESPKSVFAAMRKIAKEQTKVLSDIFQQSSDKAYAEAYNLAVKTIEVDGRKDADTSAVFNINANSTPNSKDVLFGTIVLNTIMGISGPGVLTISGCDYHDGTATTGDNKDTEIGQTIGRAVELAYRKKRPLFIQLITDGGVDSAPGTRQWRGDSGVRGMSAIGYFDPLKVPTYMSPTSMQIGFYNSSQAADTSSLIGSSSAKAGFAAFANYLQVSGRIGDFEKYAPNVFSKKDLDSVLVFGA